MSEILAQIVLSTSSCVYTDAAYENYWVLGLLSEVYPIFQLFDAFILQYTKTVGYYNSIDYPLSPQQSTLNSGLSIQNYAVVVACIGALCREPLVAGAELGRRSEHTKRHLRLGTLQGNQIKRHHQYIIVQISRCSTNAWNGRIKRTYAIFTSHSGSHMLTIRQQLKSGCSCKRQRKLGKHTRNFRCNET